jgi:hypothetical protein
LSGGIPPDAIIRAPGTRFLHAIFQDRFGQHCSSSPDSAAAAKLLITHGADWRRKTSAGETAMQMAASAHSVSGVALFAGTYAEGFRALPQSDPQDQGQTAARIAYYNDMMHDFKGSLRAAVRQPNISGSAEDPALKMINGIFGTVSRGFGWSNSFESTRLLISVPPHGGHFDSTGNLGHLAVVHSRDGSEAHARLIEIISGIEALGGQATDVTAFLNQRDEGGRTVLDSLILRGWRYASAHRDRLDSVDKDLRKLEKTLRLRGAEATAETQALPRGTGGPTDLQAGPSSGVEEQPVGHGVRIRALDRLVDRLENNLRS